MAFCNAINSRGREEYVRQTVEEARLLAATHHPFNNTKVTIERVVYVFYDGTQYEDVPLSSSSSSP